MTRTGRDHLTQARPAIEHDGATKMAREGRIMLVRDVLANKPIQGVETISAQETLTGLAAHLREKNIGSMVVTGPEGGMVGVISERDVVRAIADDGDSAMRRSVASYMTREVVTATPDDHTVEVLERMTQGRFRHMPVIERGELIGLISIGDVVKIRIAALQRDNALLEEFIRS